MLSAYLKPSILILLAGCAAAPSAGRRSSQSATETHPWPQHTGAVRCLELTPDGKVLLSAADDGTLLGWQICNVASPILEVPVPGRPDHISVTGDGLRVLLVSKFVYPPCAVETLVSSGATELKTFPLKGSVVKAFYIDGGEGLIVFDATCEASIIDGTTGTVMHARRLPGNHMLTVATSPTQRFFGLLSRRGGAAGVSGNPAFLTILDRRLSEEHSCALPEDMEPMPSQAVFLDSGRLALLTQQGRVVVWERDDEPTPRWSQRPPVCAVPDGLFSAAAAMSDGTQLCVARGSQLWCIAIDGNEALGMNWYFGRGQILAIKPILDDEHVAIGFENGRTVITTVPRSGLSVITDLGQEVDTRGVAGNGGNLDLDALKRLPLDCVDRDELFRRIDELSPGVRTIP
jgi:hypothetical protein